MKLAVNIVLLLALFTSVATAVDLESVTARYSGLLESPEKSGATAATGRFTSFAVATGDSLARDTARYELSFEIAGSDQLTLHLGAFLFAFPEGYDLSRADFGTLTDDHPGVEYRIERTLVDANVLALSLDYTKTGGGSTKSDSVIAFSLVVDNVTNPPLVGSKILSGLALDVSEAILAGPVLSDPFLIAPQEVARIEIQPSNALTLAAGTARSFTAAAYDEFDNRIEGLAYTWQLVPSDTTAIGILTENTLQATRVGEGRVIVRHDPLADTSGLITVVPGPLADLDLRIARHQLVGKRLFGPATVTLLDAFGNIRTNHDLAAQPVELLVPTGRFIPDRFDDNSALNNGVIDLAAQSVRYDGRTALVEVVAASGTVESNHVTVSFSGYDITAVLGPDANPLTFVYADGRTGADIVVRNDGLLAPSGSVEVLAEYVASPGVAGPVTFSGGSNGAVDTVQLLLPSNQSGADNDTVLVLAGSFFLIDGRVHEVYDSVWVPVTVVAPVELSLATDTVGPDTVYPGVAFDLDFAVDAANFAGPIDSSYLIVSLVENDAPVAAVYDDAIAHVSFVDGVISYENIPAVLAEDAGLAPGSYQYRLDYVLYSRGVAYHLRADADSATVLAAVDVVYRESTLQPRSVAAGHPAAFTFELAVNNDYPVAVDPSQSTLSIQGQGFTASTNLIFENDRLLPGLNTITTEELYIPAGQLGATLSLRASFSAGLPAVGASVSVQWDFAGETVLVEELPVARILDLEIVAPNAPRVNTLQSFRARGVVASESATAIETLQLSLTSDGNSTFDTVKTITGLAPYDTTEVYFDCVAAGQPTSAEIFRAQLQGEGVMTLPPENNIALVTIELPADLYFTYTLFGVNGGLIDHNTDFGLTVELNNRGQAETTEGAYLLTTGGVEFGTDDSLRGSIREGRHLEFQFTAPSFDTAATFEFSLAVIPLDRNTGQPAAIDAASFSFDIRVESQDADLFVEVAPLGSNLVTPGRSKDIFEMTLTNRGVSDVAAIRLQEVLLRLGDVGSAGDVVDPENTAVFENRSVVPTVVETNGFAAVSFPEFLIRAGESRTIVFHLGVTDDPPERFTVSLESDLIDAVFEGGSLDGRPVSIATPGDERVIFSRTYAVRGAGLEESFVVENNPFNPLDQPARFSYELPEPSLVEFRVFTLTGEEVYARDIPESQFIGTEQEVQWDGRNNDGRMVNNGVYIVSIKIASTGDQAIMKVAVVK